jgi:hypothetical protein
MGQYVREEYAGYLGGAFHDYATGFGDMISGFIDTVTTLLKTLAEGVVALISTLIQPQQPAAPTGA